MEINEWEHIKVLKLTLDTKCMLNRCQVLLMMIITIAMLCY